MATFDPDNFIKMFKIDDTEDSGTDAKNMELIPAKNDVFQTIFHFENGAPESVACQEILQDFPEDGIGLLLQYRLEQECFFHDCGDVLGLSSLIWDEIANELQKNGFMVTGTDCSRQWAALYTEYQDIVRSDDEERILQWKYYTAFESVYGSRSKYVDSKILEDVADYLSSQPEHYVPTKPALMNTTEKSTNSGTDIAKENPCDEEWLNSTGEDSLTIKEAVTAAQEVLDENIEELSNDMVDRPVTAELSNICWDEDSTQCFLDLRLYIENSNEAMQCVLTNYGDINKFVSQKMIFHGYQISEIECKQKWTQLLSQYNMEVKIMKDNKTYNTQQLEKKYFWQMDRVLKKSVLAKSCNDQRSFRWNEYSVRRLISIRIPMGDAFAVFKRYIILWQHVAAEMKKYQFSPTYRECSIKWMELCENYMICLESLQNGKKPEDIEWVFYQDMRQEFDGTAKNFATTNLSPTPDLHVEDENFTAAKSAEQQVVASSSPSVSNSETQTATGIMLGIPKESEVPNAENTSTTHTSQASSCSCSLVDTESDDEEVDVDVETTPRSAAKVTMVTVGGSYQQQNFAWTEEADLLLIKLKVRKEFMFMKSITDECNIWEKIAADMRSAGHNLSDEACATRWFELKAEFDNGCTKNSKAICSEYQQLLTSMAIPATIHTKTDKKTMNREQCVQTEKQEMRVNWDKKKTNVLIRLKFSEHIKELKFYGMALSCAMKAVGYNVDPVDCVKKWGGLFGMYKSLVRNKSMAGSVQWPYFLIINDYVRSSSSNTDFEVKNSNSQLSYTPATILNLIEIRTSIKYVTWKPDSKLLSLIWKRVSTVMNRRGFNISMKQCFNLWNILLATYWKTKRDLCNGHSDEKVYYFDRMDAAINKFNAAMAKEILAADHSDTDISQKPIDYSLGRNKRKIDKNIIDNDEIEIIHNAKNFPPIKKHAQRVPEKTVHIQIENSHIMNNDAINLSAKATAPCVKSSTSINSLIKTDKLPEKNNPEKRIVNSSMQDTAEVELPDTCKIINTQQKENRHSDEHLENEKENSAAIGRILPAKKFDRFILVCKNTKMIQIQPRILCEQEQDNTMSCVDRINHGNQPQGVLQEIISNEGERRSLLKDRAVNSTHKIGEEKIKIDLRWSGAATHVFVDLIMEIQREEGIVSFSQLDTLWSRIAKEMKVLLYDYTHEECRQRWNCMKNAYEHRIANAKGAMTVQAWYLFRKIHQIYTKLEKPIMTKKRAHSPDKEDHISPKQRILAVEPVKTVLSTGRYSLQMLSDKSEFANK